MNTLKMLKISAKVWQGFALALIVFSLLQSAYAQDRQATVTAWFEHTESRLAGSGAGASAGLFAPIGTKTLIVGKFGGLAQPSTNGQTIYGQVGIRRYFKEPASNASLWAAPDLNQLSPYFGVSVIVANEPFGNRQRTYIAPVFTLGANYKNKLFPYYAHQFAEAQSGLDARGSRLGAEVILPINARWNFYADLALANRRRAVADGALWNWRTKAEFGLGYKF